MTSGVGSRRIADRKFENRPFGPSGDDECPLKIDHRLASRRHAQIECVAGKFLLQDHGTNGTYVDDGAGGTPVLVQRELYQLKGTGVISLETIPII